MLKRTIKYTDYNGVDREEDFYFNLSQAEVTEMELSITGGLVQKINKIVATEDGPEIVKLFQDIILSSYGEKSADGRRFIKSEELSTGFSQTEAYSNLFMELATNADAAAAFVNAILPNPEDMPKPKE
jgi:two-component sensor histidine kinase